MLLRVASLYVLLCLIPTGSIAQTNSAPSYPTPLYPFDYQTNVQVLEYLRWDATDPDGDPLVFNVYFGTTSPPPLFASDITDKKFWPGSVDTNNSNAILGLEFSTTYYWAIEARDPSGATARSITYIFTTAANTRPVVSRPSPPNGATNLGEIQDLHWGAQDEYYFSLTYDVYFGTTNPPPLLERGTHGTSHWQPGTLPGVQYFWKVVARDRQGLESDSPVWTFTRAKTPVVFDPSPPDHGIASAVTYHPTPDGGPGGATLTFEWTATQPDSLPLLGSIRFGTEPGVLLQLARDIPSDSTMTRFSYPLRISIEPDVTYYWAVVAYNGGTYIWGPVWSFTGVGADGGEPVKVSGAGPNYPNPFNPETTIPYNVPLERTPVHVRVVIYDAAGREVRTLVNEKQPGGIHQVKWNGRDTGNQPASSGVYFCVIEAGNERRTQKLVLLK